MTPKRDALYLTQEFLYGDLFPFIYIISPKTQLQVFDESLRFFIEDPLKEN